MERGERVEVGIQETGHDKRPLGYRGPIYREAALTWSAEPAVGDSRYKGVEKGADLIRSLD